MRPIFFSFVRHVKKKKSGAGLPPRCSLYYPLSAFLQIHLMTADAQLQITYFSSMRSERHWVLNGALLCVRSTLLTSVSKRKKTHKGQCDTGQRLSSHNVSNHAQKHAHPLATLPLTRLHSAFDRANDGNGWQRDRQRGRGREREKEEAGSRRQGPNSNTSQHGALWAQKLRSTNVCVVAVD